MTPWDFSLPGSSVPGDTPGKNTGVGSLSLLQGNLPNPGVEPGSPAFQVDSLPTELPQKALHVKQEGQIYTQCVIHEDY